MKQWKWSLLFFLVTWESRGINPTIQTTSKAASAVPTRKSSAPGAFSAPTQTNSPTGTGTSNSSSSSGQSTVGLCTCPFRQFKSSSEPDEDEDTEPAGPCATAESESIDWDCKMNETKDGCVATNRQRHIKVVHQCTYGLQTLCGTLYPTASSCSKMKLPLKDLSNVSDDQMKCKLVFDDEGPVCIQDTNFQNMPTIETPCSSLAATPPSHPPVIEINDSCASVPVGPNQSADELCSHESCSLTITCGSSDGLPPKIQTFNESCTGPKPIPSKGGSI